MNRPESLEQYVEKFLIESNGTSNGLYSAEKDIYKLGLVFGGGFIEQVMESLDILVNDISEKEYGYYESYDSS